MRRVYLPEKYLFRKEYIEPYQTGQKFPGLNLKPTQDGIIYSVSKRRGSNLKLVPFVDWYIQVMFDPERILLDGSVEGKSIFERASREISINNYFNGVKGFIMKPSEDELINGEYMHSGSVETATEYLDQLTRAISCCRQKNVPEDRWPLDAIITHELDERSYFGRILDGIGKPDLFVIGMGNP